MYVLWVEFCSNCAVRSVSVCVSLVFRPKEKEEKGPGFSRLCIRLITVEFHSLCILLRYLHTLVTPILPQVTLSVTHHKVQGMLPTHQSVVDKLLSVPKLVSHFRRPINYKFASLARFNVSLILHILPWNMILVVYWYTEVALQENLLGSIANGHTDATETT